MPAPHHSVFTGRIPFLPPNQQRQSTEGTLQIVREKNAVCTRRPKRSSDYHHVSVVNENHLKVLTKIVLSTNTKQSTYWTIYALK